MYPDVPFTVGMLRDVPSACGFVWMAAHRLLGAVCAEASKNSNI